MPRAALIIVTLTALTPTAYAYGPRVPQPLVPHQRATIYGAPEDVLDKPLCKGGRRWATLRCRDPRHYVVTNEFDHQLFYPYIAGLRGGYAGVGADQSFTFIAWARSELAFLLDYDPVVVRVNLVHLAMIKHSPDVLSFVARYGEQGRAAAVAILRRAYAGHPEQKQIIADYEAQRQRLAEHFRHVLGTRYLQSHWLHAPRDYRYVQQLALRDRIRVMKGDLLKGKTVSGIGAVTHRLGIPLRVLYLSNSEDFWRYPKAFRESIASLRTDERSVVLRLWEDRAGCQPRRSPFVYVVHDSHDFQKKLGARRRYRSVKAFAREAQPAGEDVATIGPVEQLAPARVPLIPVPRRPRASQCPRRR